VTKTNIEGIPWTERRSPTGRFHIQAREITIAMGYPRGVGDWGGGLPFDVSIHRMPPGAANFPFHAHTAQTEFYLVISGRGTLRIAEGNHEIGPGDAFVCPPGEGHQIKNSGTEDLTFYIIADNVRVEVVNYPDSNKWAVTPPRKIFRLEEKDYYDGEE
jgi:uncharacterized cupin superfamily protein